MAWNRVAVVGAGLIKMGELFEQSYEQMAAYHGTAFNLSGGDGRLPERIQGVMCTYNLFSTLGVQPSLGRSFRPDDDQPNAERQAIISHGLWQRAT